MEHFVTYLDAAIEKTNKKEAELVASERKDEANLQRIRANVYGICKTVFQVVSKTSKPETIPEEYNKKMEAVSGNWLVSYEKAKAHNDVEKLLIEETKLEVLREVEAHLLNVCGK